MTDEWIVRPVTVWEVIRSGDRRPVDRVATEGEAYRMALLVAASLVFEVKLKDEDDDWVWHGNYKSLEGNSPHHIAGLLHQTAEYILR